MTMAKKNYGVMSRLSLGTLYLSNSKSVAVTALEHLTPKKISGSRDPGYAPFSKGIMSRLTPYFKFEVCSFNRFGANKQLSD